ncbi:hypothetical protein ACXR0O_14915 [Verrucomicrobiota bacterium sgz303538]
MKAVIDQSTSPQQNSVGSSTIADLLAPVHDVALTSSSLIASRHQVQIGNADYEISKFLLLGQRGGGRPMRIALFAGLDEGAIETTVALTRLLLQLELAPSLARDYALFGYPIVNLGAFDDRPTALTGFQARFAADRADQDVQFFKSELQKWSFDGLISLRVDVHAEGFYATTRSQVIAKEVVAPALEAISSKYPLRSALVDIRSSDRQARLADHAQGKLTAPAGSRPYPFEIEVFAPASLPVEQRVTGLFLAVQEILRGYRHVISHAQDI